MVRNKGKLYVVGGRKETETKTKLEDEVDALFRLPLAEFTSARNTLAAQLKKSGRGAEAFLVKGLVKPSVSAWTVNQLYWNHRDAFDQLIASGERFHKAQASPSAGKLANMRTALDARRESLTQLSELATSLLRDAGHNPAPDTVHRITTTLEAMSVYASRSDAPRPGRLTQDVDPPGFDSLAGFVPGAGVMQATAKREEARVREQTAETTALDPKTSRFTQKSGGGPTSTRRKFAPVDDVRQLEEARKSKIAEAKISVQEAKRSLTEARARAQSLDVTQKKVSAEARKAEQLKRDAEESLKKAERLRRDAEESLDKARAVAENATRRAQTVGVDVKEAATLVDDAQRTVASATKYLESLL